jgi:hypothetical protein
METKLEDLTSTLVEIYNKLDRVHFWRIVNSYGQRYQMALILGVYETLDDQHQVELLHDVQNLASSPL